MAHGSNRPKSSYDRQFSLKDKSQATLPYYCSRSDMRSSSSLHSSFPNQNAEGKPLQSTDNLSQTCQDKKNSTNAVVADDGMTRSCRLLSESPKPTQGRNLNFSSEPATPEASNIDVTGRSLSLMNSERFKNIDHDDDDEDNAMMPSRNDQNQRRYSQSTGNDESTMLLIEPRPKDDNADEEERITSPEVATESNDRLQRRSTTQAKSKWNKLRNTVKMAGAFSPNNRKKGALEREDSFLKKFSTRQGGGLSTKDNLAEASYEGEGSRSMADLRNEEVRIQELNDERFKRRFVIGPNDTFMYAWLSMVTATILYNLWTCIAREAFSESHSSSTSLWIAADLACDAVYMLDIFIQFRTGYLEHGLIVYKSNKLCFRYMKSREFAMDLVSLLPLDLLQFHFGIHPILRFPRFIKSYRLFRFVYMVETRTAYPNMWRVANLSHTIFLGCHWFAAFYFLISKQENFSTEWGYPSPRGDHLGSVTQKYLRSLYWSTLTLTTIGDMPPPETSWEFVFTITSYLIGVFVFATIVGQVGNVITNRNASRQEFERHLDGAKAYMRNHNVPSEVQKRVQRWYDYAWNRGRMNGGGDINSLGLLPDKLKTELALHVNLETLRKVSIFHECEPEFLHDLVLKMRAFIFTPGDLICRKGEVAREMFIIADGLIEVVSDSGDILKQMSAGDFFGEIGILNLDGVNKRTADVRSVGYSELFVLSRDDVLSAFRDHPEAEKLIKDYGRKRLQELDEHKKKKMTAYLAKKIKEKSSTGELRNLLSMDLSPTGASEGPINNFPPIVSTGDKWLSLTANLLQQARKNVDDKVEVVGVERTGEADASKVKVVAVETEVKPNDQSDELHSTKAKRTFRFSKWKTKLKVVENPPTDDVTASSCLLTERDVPDNSNNNNNNNNSNNNNSDTNNDNHANNNNNNKISYAKCIASCSSNASKAASSSEPRRTSHNNQKLTSVLKAVRRGRLETPKHLSSPDSSGVSPSPHSAFSPSRQTSRGLDDVIDPEDFSTLCQDVSKSLIEVWYRRFVGGQMKKFEEKISTLEAENRRQRDLIERLHDQLRHYQD